MFQKNPIFKQNIWNASDLVKNNIATQHFIHSLHEAGKETPMFCIPQNI